MIFCVENQEIGDIILIKNKSMISKANVAAQFAGTLKYSYHSHALLALSQGTFIEAMNYVKNIRKFGVDLVCITELLTRFSDEYEDNWKVIRCKSLTNTQKENIENRSSYYFGQMYNKNILIRGAGGESKKHSSYCSELIARVYEDIGIEIKKRDVWPSHLNKLPKDNPELWEDVTDVYRQECSVFNNNALLNTLCKHDRHSKHLVLRANLGFRDIINTSNELHNYLLKNKDNDELLKSNEFADLYSQIIGEKTFYNQFILHFNMDDHKKNIEPMEFKGSWVVRDMKFEKQGFDNNVSSSVKLIEVKTQLYEKLSGFVIPYSESIVKCFKDNNEYCEVSSSIAMEMNKNITIFSNKDLFDSHIKIDSIADNYEEKFSVKTKLKHLLWLVYFLGEFKKITFEVLHTQENCENIVHKIAEIPTFDSFLSQCRDIKKA